MNIAFFADDNYLIPLLIMIESLLKHNKTPVKFYTLLSLLSQNSIEKINSVLEKYGKENELINISFSKECKDCINKKEVCHDFSSVVYYRLFLPFIENIDRILYLDTDILIRGDIGSFYNTDFKDDLIACVPDICFHDRIKVVALLKDYGSEFLLKKYYNSGVILYNCKKIRELYSEQSIISAVDGIYKKLVLRIPQCDILPDQDIFNVIFQKKIQSCNRYFNFHWEYGVILNRAQIFHSKNARIIHFTGPDKPWEKGYINVSVFEYFDYLKKYLSAKQIFSYLCTKFLKLFKDRNSTLFVKNYIDFLLDMWKL